MGFHKLPHALSVLVGAAVFVVAVGSPSAAEEPVRWKMASAVSSSVVILGTTAKGFTEKIAAISGGDFVIKFYEPGALVPPLEMFDAVAKGSIEAAWAPPGFWAGKIRAAPLFSAMPFGPLGGRVPGLGLPRRRPGAVARDPGPARHLLGVLLARGTGGVRLVSRGDHLGRRPQRPQDAVLGIGCVDDGEARRLDPAAGARRRLSGARARRDRCHRILHAGGRPQPRLPRTSPSTTISRAGISRRPWST